MSGPRMIARASTARCFWPPERSVGYLSANCDAGARPTRSSASATRRSRSALPVGDPVEAQRVADRGADRHRRVQRCVRVLEDDLQPPAKRAHLGLAEPGDLLALELDAAAGRLDQPEQGPAQRRLARARLADEPEDLAVAKVEADPVDGGDRSGLPAAEAVDERAADRVVGVQVADLDQRLGLRRRASSQASITPPPRSRSRRARAARCRPRGISSSGPCSQQATRWPPRRVDLERLALRRRPASRSGSAGGSGSPAAGRSGPAAPPGCS